MNRGVALAVDRASLQEIGFSAKEFLVDLGRRDLVADQAADEDISQIWQPTCAERGILDPNVDDGQRACWH